MGLLDWLKGRGTRADAQLGGWRRAWAAALDAPDRSQVLALQERLDALTRPEDEIEIEREMLDGLAQLVELRSSVANGDLPVVETGHRVVGSDVCHFSAPASLPDVAAQPSGRLLLTSRRAIFVGGVKGLTLRWHTVAQVAYADRDIVLIRIDREALHRFRCNTFGDAMCGTFLAQRLCSSRRRGSVPPLSRSVGESGGTEETSPFYNLGMPVSIERRAVSLGIDRLLTADRRLIAGRRIGLVCNPASIDAVFTHTADRLLQEPDVRLVALFGPQHGVRSNVQDNMIETPHDRDRRRQVPVYSLYSETREPTAAMLRDLDVLVIDLQDVGTRVYTFVYTMANCMRAAGRHGVEVVVCDRPNPIGGDHIEGPLLRDSWTSFVGQFPIPLRHGMTIGELARMFNDEFRLGCSLDVVPLEGWQRGMYHDDTRLPWVLPSPNIPTLDSAIVYPGAVLFEGTNLSEGRGTTRPFELIGAPWIDGDRLANDMNGRGLSGVHFRPVFFEPTFQKHAGQTCGGCQIHVLDRRAFRPVRTALELLAAFRREDPAQFAWRRPPYEYEREKEPIDILYGSDHLRRTMNAGDDVAAVIASWKPDEEAFQTQRERFLLY